MLLVGLAGILFLSWLPKFPTVPLVPPDAIGLIGHIVIYGALTALIYGIVSLSNGTGRFTFNRSAISFLISMAIGIAIELLQTQFATRTSSLSDIAMNIVGGMTAITLIALWTRTTQRI